MIFTYGVTVLLSCSLPTFTVKGKGRFPSLPGCQGSPVCQACVTSLFEFLKQPCMGGKQISLSNNTFRDVLMTLYLKENRKSL